MFCRETTTETGQPVTVSLAWSEEESRYTMQVINEGGEALYEEQESRPLFELKAILADMGITIDDLALESVWMERLGVDASISGRVCDV